MIASSSDTGPTSGTTGTGTTSDARSGTSTGGNGQGAYAYDAFGRQTTIPKADTPTGDGDLSIGYYDDDAPRKSHKSLATIVDEVHSCRGI